MHDASSTSVDDQEPRLEPEAMNASDVMTRDVLTVTPDTPIQRIARLQLEHGISAVPVRRSAACRA
jgi:CBS domain-containing protein